MRWLTWPAWPTCLPCGPEGHRRPHSRHVLLGLRMHPHPSLGLIPSRPSIHAQAYSLFLPSFLTGVNEAGRHAVGDDVAARILCTRQEVWQAGVGCTECTWHPARAGLASLCPPSCRWQAGRLAMARSGRRRRQAGRQWHAAAAEAGRHAGRQAGRRRGGQGEWPAAGQCRAPSGRGKVACLAALAAAGAGHSGKQTSVQRSSLTARNGLGHGNHTCDRQHQHTV